MKASKRTIYLTKNHQLQLEDGPAKNAFMFNANGPMVAAKWAQKNISQNDGCFVVLDHNNMILRASERDLQKRNYYIEKVNCSEQAESICINPFDLVKDTSEIHFMFLSFLHAMWDNTDPDISAMSNLIDAFASCVFFMFASKKEKINMQTLRKMVYSVRATCQTDNGVVTLSDAIFAGIKDQNSMPCKYYAQFKKASGERKEEVAEKVAKVFDMFTENDMNMMRETDPSLTDTFNFKTAVFVNADPDNEHSGKIMAIMLNYFIQRVAKHSHVLFIIDNLDAKHGLVSLPYWLKESADYNVSFLVICDDLASFKSNERAEKYFRNLQKAVSASVLVHQNDSAIKFADKLPSTEEEMNEFVDAQECVATVLIPEMEVSTQDDLF